jgi:hypothetical protein
MTIPRSLVEALDEWRENAQRIYYNSREGVPVDAPPPVSPDLQIQPLRRVMRGREPAMKKRSKRGVAQPDRYVVKAYFGPDGFSKMSDHEGSSTFYEVWIRAPDACTHIVMMRGPNEWLVTDRFRSIIRGDAYVVLGPHDIYKDLDTAMMAAAMSASRGHNLSPTLGLKTTHGKELQCR